MALNDGQGQYNEHLMPYNVWGSYCAKFDDDDFNSFWRIACEGHRHTDRLGVLFDFEKKNQQKIISTTKEVISIERATMVGNFLHDLDCDWKHLYGLTSVL